MSVLCVPESVCVNYECASTDVRASMCVLCVCVTFKVYHAAMCTTEISRPALPPELKSVSLQSLLDRALSASTPVSEQDAFSPMSISCGAPTPKPFAGSRRETVSEQEMFSPMSMSCGLPTPKPFEFAGPRREVSSPPLFFGTPAFNYIGGDSPAWRALEVLSPASHMVYREELRLSAQRNAQRY